MANIYSQIRTMLVTPEIRCVLEDALSPREVAEYVGIYGRGTSRPHKSLQKKHHTYLNNALENHGNHD